MLKAVIDTNLLVSVLLQKSSTVLALAQYLREKRFAIVTSDALLAELIAVAARPKFARYFNQDDIDELIVLILARSEQVKLNIEIDLYRDPKDNFLLDLAASAHADCLVTGDKDFLDDNALKKTMQENYGVKVVSVVEFLQIV